MAAPIANKIILPLDTGNTGKNVRTQTRVVGADTVHEHFMIPISSRNQLGSYRANPGQLTPPIAVQTGTTSGMWWLYNPIGSTVKMAVVKIVNNYQFAALAVDLVPGDFRVSRFTFTGTGTGTQITPIKNETADSAPVGQLRTAMTGLTITLVATAFAENGPVMQLATGAGGVWPPMVGEPYEPDEDRQIILTAGEGIVYWSAAALTTANRRVMSNISWEEFE